MVKPLYLLDSTIIIEPLKKNPDKNIMNNLFQKSNDSVISVTTWEELLYKVYNLPDGRLKDAATDYLFERINSNFKIINYDSHSAQICAEIKYNIKKDNMYVSYYDIELAATAISQNLILITNNIEPFEIIADYTTLMFEKW